MKARNAPFRLAAAALLLWGCQTGLEGCAEDRSPRSVSFQGATMGTYANLTLVTTDSIEAGADARAAQRTFARVDSLMSNWTRTSEVARINREAPVRTVTLHPEVATVVEEALRIGVESGGAFDITVEPLVRLWGFLGGRPRVPAREEIERVLPRIGLSNLFFDVDAGTLRFRDPGVRLDLGGIAKGHGVDAAARMLRARGVKNALVDISGNMIGLGRPPGRESWVIGIRDPRDRVPYFGRLALQDDAVATSGKYEQFVSRDGREYGHILDPRTGWSSEGLISVTVVAPTATEADAWGTALFVLGPDPARRLAGDHEELGAILVQPGADRDTVWVEEALMPRFEMDPAAAHLFHVLPF